METTERDIVVPDFDVEWLGDVQRINCEVAYNSDTGEFDDRKLKVECPGCERKFAALCSKYTEEAGGGWKWVGQSHKEPYTVFKTTCRKCKETFKFEVYAPQ